MKWAWMASAAVVVTAVGCGDAGPVDSCGASAGLTEKCRFGLGSGGSGGGDGGNGGDGAGGVGGVAGGAGGDTTEERVTEYFLADRYNCHFFDPACDPSVYPRFVMAPGGLLLFRAPLAQLLIEAPPHRVELWGKQELVRDGYGAEVVGFVNETVSVEFTLEERDGATFIEFPFGSWGWIAGDPEPGYWYTVVRVYW
ncbi:MAG: hypothetical protein AAGF92_02090 [Myxococcota bacterium]